MAAASSADPPRPTSKIQIPNPESQIPNPNPNSRSWVLGFGVWDLNSLEAEFHAELHDPGRACLRLDAAERAGAQIGPGIPPVEMVQEVERLGPQLQRVARTK